jgi:hypothetical protein
MSYRLKCFLLASVPILVLAAVGRLNVTTAQTDSFANHHKELHFALPPDQSPTFSLPAKNKPVQILVSTSNVTVSFNGSTITAGPLLLSALATIDSAAGIANTDFPSCTGQDTCQVTESFFNVRDPNNSGNAGAVRFLFTIDRHTGNISLSVLGTTGPTIPVFITSGEINYTIVMNY